MFKWDDTQPGWYWVGKRDVSMVRGYIQFRYPAYASMKADGKCKLYSIMHTGQRIPISMDEYEVLEKISHLEAPHVSGVRSGKTFMAFQCAMTDAGVDPAVIDAVIEKIRGGDVNDADDKSDFEVMP